MTVLMMVCFLAVGEPKQIGLDQVNLGLAEVYAEVVRQDGSVDYAALAANPDRIEKLEQYVRFMKTFDPATLTTDKQRIAVLSNTYNAFTLVGVMRKWPVSSVRKIAPFFGFFTKDGWMIGGKKYSLNKIEGMIRDLDPRIHFIINCASASCPVLRPEVLTEDNVERIMDEATRQFLQDESKNQFDRAKDEWRLSKIFDWYPKDFGGKEAVVPFIRRHRPDLATWTPKKVRYLEYDWALNGPTTQN